MCSIFYWTKGCSIFYWTKWCFACYLTKKGALYITGPNGALYIIGHNNIKHPLVGSRGSDIDKTCPTYLDQRDPTSGCYVYYLTKKVICIQPDQRALHILLDQKGALYITGPKRCSVYYWTKKVLCILLDQNMLCILFTNIHIAPAGRVPWIRY